MIQLVRNRRRASMYASLISWLFLFGPARAQAQGPWIGAGPEGGMVRTIVIAPTTPQTTYAGTGSGVFKRVSVNGTWTLASDGLGDVDVWSLALDPSDPETLLAGTSAGVFKTSNGGASWTPSSSGLPTATVQVIAIDPAAALVVYAGTHSGVYKSVDGGGTWQSANNASAGVISSLAVDPHVSGTVYASNGTDIFKTVDGGGTWVTRNSGLEVLYGAIETIAVDPFHPGVVLTAKRYTIDVGGTPSLRAAIFRSGDFAATWSRIPHMFGDRDRILAFAFDPLVPGRVLAGTGQGVIGSDTAGASWGLLSLTGAAVRGLAFGRDTPWIVWAGTAARGVVRGDYGRISPIAGLEWFADNAGLTATATQAIAVDPNDPDTVYAIDSDVGDRLANPFTPTAFRSWNGGRSWLPMSVGPYYMVTSAIVADPLTSGTVYAGVTDTLADQGIVFRSIDAGATWAQLSTVGMKGVSSIIVDAAHPGTLYVVASTVLKSVDAGRSWTAAGPATGVNGRVSILAVDPSNPNVLFASAGNGLYRSADGGTSWQGLTAFPAAIRAIAIPAVNPGGVYVATSQGVFISTDDGRTFTPRNSGLLSLDVAALVADPLAPLTLYAGTTAAGVFRTTDGGVTWRPLSDGLRTLAVTAIGVGRTFRPRLYAGTAHAGVHTRMLAPPSLGAPPRATPLVYRASAGQWFARQPSGDVVSATFGEPGPGDVPVPGDYDGDGLRDAALYRPATSEFVVLRSSDGGVTSRRLGEPGLSDLAVPADYDGDGLTDFAVLRPSTGAWMVLYSATNDLLVSIFGDAYFGPSLIPLPADYDADGRTDIAFCYRYIDSLVWVFRLSSSTPYRRMVYGNAGLGDIPQPADYDGDGKADIAVYRQTTGQWFIFGSTAGQLAPFQFGSPADDDIPVAGDYDGDGRADVAVYRKSTGEWFWFGSTSGFSGPVAISGTAPGDIPLTGVR